MKGLYFYRNGKRVLKIDFYNFLKKKFRMSIFRDLTSYGYHELAEIAIMNGFRVDSPTSKLK